MGWIVFIIYIYIYIYKVLRKINSWLRNWHYISQSRIQAYNISTRFPSFHWLLTTKTLMAWFLMSLRYIPIMASMVKVNFLFSFVFVFCFLFILYFFLKDNGVIHAVNHGIQTRHCICWKSTEVSTKKCPIFWWYGPILSLLSSKHGWIVFT